MIVHFPLQVMIALLLKVAMEMSKCVPLMTFNQRFLELLMHYSGAKACFHVLQIKVLNVLWFEED